MILRFASEIMNRAVLFMLKKNDIVGLGEFGLVIEGEDANKRVRRMKLPSDEPSVFREAIHKRAILKKGMNLDEKWNRYVVQQLGGAVPSEAFVAPIFSAGKVVALLYGDNVPERRAIGDTTALEIFLAQAGMAMDRALLERKLRELRSKDDKRPHARTL
jgi:hypothetical protein